MDISTDSNGSTDGLHIALFNEELLDHFLANRIPRDTLAIINFIGHATNTRGLAGILQSGFIKPGGSDSGTRLHTHLTPYSRINQVTGRLDTLPFDHKGIFEIVFDTLALSEELGDNCFLSNSGSFLTRLGITTETIASIFFHPLARPSGGKGDKFLNREFDVYFAQELARVTDLKERSERAAWAKELIGYGVKKNHDPCCI